MKMLLPEGIEIKRDVDTSPEKILTPSALQFLAKLHRKFEPQRHALLQKRPEKIKKVQTGFMPNFPSETAEIRSDLSWRVAETPKDLKNRTVEITGPTERKMMINAFNSGANVFMADFEDANSPTWKNMVEGQLNLCDAVDKTIAFTSPEGKEYKLHDHIATLMVRPRGWHLDEKHICIDDIPLSASLFDFGLYFFHNAKKLIKNGSGPYFYLPKMESYHEARLWNEVFLFAQQELSIPRGTIRATVLIETLFAAFEMEEILYELREHSAGLNAGRWDYIFSTIKAFHGTKGFLLPDRGQITMTVPFMRAYSKLLVQTCLKRSAQPIGGMAAFIPNRKDKEINEIAIAKVKEDKIRESQDGFVGTWVAHPDLVYIAHECFRQTPSHPKSETSITASQLSQFNIQEGKITEKGLRQNINVTLQYLEGWLRGVGAVAIFNLMEDTATAEISRTQIWDWIHTPSAKLEDGRKIDSAIYQKMALEELEKIRTLYKEHQYHSEKLDVAKQILDQLVTHPFMIDFLTSFSYEYLD